MREHPIVLLRKELIAWQINYETATQLSWLAQKELIVRNKQTEQCRHRIEEINSSIQDAKVGDKDFI